MLIKTFLESKGTHILLLDDDEVMPKGLLKKMLDMSSPIVIADAPSKGSGKSNIFRNKDGEIVATGFGCALIRREVFAELEKPYFSLKPWRHVKKIKGDYEFPVHLEDQANPWGGEDVNFSIKLREAGYKIKAVEDICSHLEYSHFNTDKRATQLLEIKKYDKITEAPL
jgi:ribosomal protein L33